MNIEKRSWEIEQVGFSPVRELSFEPVFTTGNGVMAVRGSVDFPLPASQPDFFVAGLYGEKAEHFPYSETKLISIERRYSSDAELVPFPSPFPFRVVVSGVAMTMASPHLRRYQRCLDLRTAKLSQEYEFHLAEHKLLLRTIRLFSLSNPHVLLQRVEVEGDWQAEVTFDFALPVASGSFEYPHLEVAEQAKDGALIFYRVRGTNQVCCFAETISKDGEVFPGTSLAVGLIPGHSQTIERVITIVANIHSKTPEKTAREIVQTASKDIAHEEERHTKRWQETWAKMDLELEGRPELTQASRFNAFQLRISASQNPRVSPGARGLTGRAYEGHVFWDSETFMFPYFLYTEPELARSMLLYRYNTLPEAKKRAAELGYRGACFAWESTLSGADVTPTMLKVKGNNEGIPILTGVQQVHVTADIAHAVWQYWDATDDLTFLRDCGAEILIETARFWASRVYQDETREYEIRGVIGPDEYHFGVNNNAYTNWMARHNLLHAAQVVEFLRRNHPKAYTDISKRLSLSYTEPQLWNKVAQRLSQPKVNPNGVIEQFDGFFKLPSPRLLTTSKLRAPIDRLLDWRSTNASNAIKQADVLMIPFLFPDIFSPETLRENYLYYEPLTDHASSLSSCVHAAIAARAGLWDHARKYFETALYTDLLNQMTNTALGIHTGSIGGTWQALVFHMAGIGFQDGKVVISSEENVCLPSGVKTLRLNLYYKGHRHPISIRSRRKAVA